MALPSARHRAARALLLRRGVGALEAERNRCADCGRTPLTGEHVHLYDGRGAGGIVCELCRLLRREAPRGERDRAPLRARPRRAPHRPRRLERSAARRTSRLARAVDPVTVSIVVSAPRERGLRLPPGHRQPRRVHRPLPGRLAPDADRLGRRGRRRALPGQGSGQPLQLGRRDVRRGRAAAPDRRGRAAPARTTASARWASTSSRPPRAARRACSFTLQTIPATLSDRLMEGLGARGWIRRKNARAMRRLRAILEGERRRATGAAAGAHAWTARDRRRPE